MSKSTLRNLLLAFLLVFGLMMTGCQKSAEAPAAAAAPAPAAPAVQVNPVETAAMAYFADFPGSRIIDTKDLMAKMDAGEKMLILDIRQADVYAQGHLKGAVNAPWGPAITASLEWLPDDMPVYVNCYTGQTAGQTVAALNVAGIQAQSIKYGWNLGISKTEGVDKYIETTANAAPESSGVKYDPAIKAAVSAYFDAIPAGGNNIIAAADLKKALDAEEDIAVVSIRQAADFANDHIEGALNIPFVKGMQEGFAQLPKDKKIVVYCYSGQTAGQTVGILRLLGYNAVSLKSGMGTPVTAPSGWSNEGFPVVK